MYTPSTYKRLSAYSIDAILQSLLISPVLMELLKYWFKFGVIQISMNQLILLIGLPILYQVLFLKFLQATLGKLMCGLRVISVHKDSQLGLGQIVLRVLSFRLSWIFSFAPFASAFYRMDRRHVLDLFADTRVVQLEPRKHVPEKRPILATLLILYFLISGLANFRQWSQHMSWEGRTLKVSIPMEFSFEFNNLQESGKAEPSDYL